LSPLGGQERKVAQFYTIFDLGGPLAAACWTPDGQYLLVTGSQTPDQPNQLLRLAVNTGEVKALASAHGGTAEGYSLPALSPDGRTVAILRRRGSSSSSVELISLSASYEFESSRPLESAGNNVGSVDWTADGRDLIFSLTSNNPLPLYRISIAGGEPQSLSWSGANASGPELSAGGERLAFVRTFRDTNIWQVSLDKLHTGETALRPLASSSFRDVFPQYSPDGKRLVFYSNREGSFQIWTSDLDGSRAAAVTAMNRDAVTGTPRWSPDGRWISFDSSATGRYQVYVISADGGPPRALTSSDSDNFTAAWSLDGSWIYFASSRSGIQQVWKVPSKGGTPQQVTQNGGQAPSVSPDGEWLYYTKNDGAGGIWKMPVAGGEETKVVDVSYRYNYAVTSQGIYFVPRIASDGTSSIRFRNFENGHETEIIKIEKPVDLGLAVSPGGRELLFSQTDYSGQDLVLVEHFK
jgi:Tol biopolymer transport system component